MKRFFTILICLLALNIALVAQPTFTSAVATSTTNIRLTFSSTPIITGVGASTTFTISGVTISSAVQVGPTNQVDLTVSTIAANFSCSDCVTLAAGAVTNGTAIAPTGPTGFNVTDGIVPSAPSATPTAAAGPLINTSENGTFSIAVGSLTSTGAVVGDVLEILVNGASFATPRTQILTAGQISSGFTFTSVALPAPDGAKNITARVTDQAGNVGASSTQLALTLNTSAPTAPSAAPTAAAGPLINASENGAFNIVVGSLTSTGAVADDLPLPLQRVHLSTRAKMVRLVSLWEALRQQELLQEIYWKF